jgi:type IV pilus assembly protein PilQ
MNMKKPGTILHAFLLWLAGLGVCAAQVNSIDKFEVNQLAGRTVVRITTKEPLRSVPPNFSVATPARIAFDFPNTVNALGRSNEDIGQGELRSMNLVQGADRTRLVLNLRRPIGHESAIEGNTLVITLAEAPLAQATAPAGVAHFAEGRQDVKHAVRDIDFRRGRAGEGRVVVDLSDSTTGIDIRLQGQNIIVDFLKTALPENLRRRLDVVDFGTPVNTVSTFQQAENVRMVIEPKGQWEHNAYQSDTQFVLEVKPIVADPARSAAQRGRYTGERLSLNFQNVEVRAVLNVIADFTDLNIITSDTVSGNITLRLKDVPWDQALEIILQTRGLDSRRSGNVIWIAPRDELATREKLALEAQNQISDLEQTRTESFQMSYQKATDVQKLLSDPTQRILSKRGSAVVDARTNTLFVQDTPSRLEEVRRLIAKIDVAMRQVMIEARIVEAADAFSRNLGARLGYTDLRLLREQARLAAAGGNPLDARTGSPLFGIDSGPRVLFGGNRSGIGILTGQTPDPGTGYIPDSFNVNLPAAGLNAFTAGQFSFSLFTSQMTRFINVELNALEADGKGKIIASPRVLTADQVEALIEQGTELPYQQSTSSGATAVSFRKANLSLKVKPQITPDGNVIMTLDVNKDQVGATTPAGVAINTKHVKTEVLVENGGTVVIGGIYEQNDRVDITKIPLLGDIPVLGFLFKNDQRSTQKTELLIFITPRIVNERLTIR